MAGDKDLDEALNTSSVLRKNSFVRTDLMTANLTVIFAGLIGLVVGVICGCERTPEQSRQVLVGHYNLDIGHDCASSGVRVSSLVLRSDGTYDQHIEFTSGEVVDEVGQHWSYDGGIHFSNFRITATGDLNKYAPRTEASLIVDLRHPVVIRLNPSSDCAYTQPK